MQTHPYLKWQWWYSATWWSQWCYWKKTTVERERERERDSHF